MQVISPVCFALLAVMAVHLCEAFVRTQKLPRAESDSDPNSAVRSLNETHTSTTTDKSTNRPDQPAVLSDYDEIALNATLRQDLAKQLGTPSEPIAVLSRLTPCECHNGVCGCCSGMLLTAFRSRGCMNLTYIPEEFAFEVRMSMNDAVLFKRRMSGRNPRPICMSPPRIGFIKMCANFYDIYFNGRNMHVCLDMDAHFQNYQLFRQSFQCMRLGDQGFGIVSPDDDSLLPTHRPILGGTDAYVDAGNDDDDDDIGDYDELLS